MTVQLLAPAEAAGILFTANPLNGRRDQTVISASWGLGEAIVGGAVTPDSLVLDKASGQVISRQISEKQVMTVRSEGGTQAQPVPESLRRAPVLEDLWKEFQGRFRRYLQDYGYSIYDMDFGTWG